MENVEVIICGNSGWKCGGIVYLAMFPFRIFESGGKNQRRERYGRTVCSDGF